MHLSTLVQSGNTFICVYISWNTHAIHMMCLALILTYLQTTAQIFPVISKCIHQDFVYHRVHLLQESSRLLLILTVTSVGFTASETEKHLKHFKTSPRRVDWRKNRLTLYLHTWLIYLMTIIPCCWHNIIITKWQKQSKKSETNWTVSEKSY